MSTNLDALRETRSESGVVSVPSAVKIRVRGSFRTGTRCVDAATSKLLSRNGTGNMKHPSQNRTVKCGDNTEHAYCCGNFADVAMLEFVVTTTDKGRARSTPRRSPSNRTQPLQRLQRTTLLSYPPFTQPHRPFVIVSTFADYRSRRRPPQGAIVSPWRKIKGRSYELN